MRMKKYFFVLGFSKDLEDCRHSVTLPVCLSVMHETRVSSFYIPFDDQFEVY